VSDPLAKQSLETIGQELVRLARMLPAAFSVAALDRNEMAMVDLRSVVEQEVRRLGTAGVSVVGSEWPRVRGDAELLSVGVAPDPQCARGHRRRRPRSPEPDRWRGDR